MDKFELDMLIWFLQNFLRVVDFIWPIEISPALQTHAAAAFIHSCISLDTYGIILGLLVVGVYNVWHFWSENYSRSAWEKSQAWTIHAACIIFVQLLRGALLERSRGSPTYVRANSTQLSNHLDSLEAFRSRRNWISVANRRLTHAQGVSNSCPADCSVASGVDFKHEKHQDFQQVCLLLLCPSVSRNRLDCNLVYYTLDRVPTYQRLSHTCNGSSLSHFIWIYHKQLRVTKSIHDSLHRLRDKTWVRFVMIDCNCIDHVYHEQAKRQQRVELSGVMNTSSRNRLHLGTSRSEKVEFVRFKYQPLDENQRQIRVLHVFRSAKSRFLKCEFVAASIESLKDSYVAISYVWGDDIIRSKILCGDGMALGLTASAAAILESVADMDTMGYIWIDALCINQIDKKEKTSQIRLMLKVYESATKVVAWLGSPTIDSHLVFPFLLRLHDASKPFYKARQKMTMETLRALPGCLLECSPEWTALRNFLQRPWFQRVWILQEAVAAKTLTLKCGNDELKWSILSNVLRLFQTWELSRMFEIREENIEELGFMPHGCRNTSVVIDIKTEEEEDYQTLHSLLISGRPFEAKDARDKVYALLGLVRDTQDAAFDAVYDISAESVYFKVASHMLSRGVSLDILHSAGIANRGSINSTITPSLHVLPSWVPDWSHRSDSTTFCEASGLNFHAGGTLPIILQIDAKSKLCTIRGTVIDVVCTMRSARPRPPLIQDELGLLQYAHNFLKWFEEHSSLANSLAPYPNGETAHDVVWRTLIANAGNSNMPAGAEYRDYFDLYKINLKLILGILTQPEQLRLEAAHSGVEMFGGALGRISGGRALFATERGYLGLGSLAIKTGDKVAVFVGGKTPFVLRENKDSAGMDHTWMLVGEVYIHGLMSGEGLAMGKMQDIILS